MQLKLSKVGNSMAVFLPKELVKSMNLDKGDAIYATKTSDGFTVSPYDPEFAEQMDIARKVMKKRRNVLRELAK